MENPDPEGAGLWIVDRDSSAVRVRIPPDCMAIQVGECTQVGLKTMLETGWRYIYIYIIYIDS